MEANGPTMTIQRAKSMGTGNLATIIEMGNYLGSQKDTVEDSFFYQANKIDKKSAYIGPHVWLKHFSS